MLRAINRAVYDEDLDRAQKIADSYRGGDQDIQRQLKDRLQFFNISETKLEQEWAQEEKSFATMPPAERAQFFLLAAGSVSMINKKFALKILDQASALADAFGPGEKQIRFQIGLASTYCRAKDDRGFAILESLLPRFNELVNAAAKLDGFDTRYLRDGEWNMSAAGSTGDLLTSLANNAEVFAWCDFDRAVSLAGQFDRAEIRIMAQLKLAQGIIAGRPKFFKNQPISLG